MPISTGTRLGSYEVVTEIGAGGMGEVYQAHDTKLGRDVAIKVLPEAFAHDPERLSRFQREAKMLAALNHPNIATIHGLEHSDGTHFLIMELVAGETLAERVKREGAVPVEEALKVAVQIAEALEAAHDKGIIHRDLKPSNVKVTPEGKVKVLDFGLAKAFAGDGEIDLSQAPTLTAMGTEEGKILGTAAYMSPEQARGKPVDKRTDIWAFGCVLYELLSARRAFRGETVTDTLAKVLEREPDWNALPGSTPAKIRYLLLRCLQKDPQRRLRDFGDVRIEIAEASTKGSAPERLSVAVLPFRLLATAPQDQFLSAALADAVAKRLAATGRLLVRPTASVMRYVQSPTEWGVVARELNVDLVVEATIQKLGERLRVLIAAYRVSDSVTLHSAKHDGTMDDLFGFQDQIAEAVCAALVPQLPKKAEPARPPTRNALAYELYLRTAERISRWTKWDTQTAIDILSSATAVDPNFADAWARLAQACIHMGVWFDSDPRWLRQAETAIARSQELDTVNSDAFCAQGQLLWTPSRKYQNRAALRALNAALKINPGCHQAQVWRGLILHHLGLYTEACQVLEEALAASPRDMLTLVCLGNTSLYRGNYEEAYDFYARAVEAEPVSIFPRIFLPTPAAYMGRHSDAIEKIRAGRQMAPDEATFVSVEAIIAARDGDFTRAEELADASLGPKKTLLHTHHLWHYAAAVFAMCGKPEKAMPLLYRCAEMGLSNYPLFGSDPHLRALHNRPEFLQFMVMLRKEHEQYCQEFGSQA